MFSKLILSDAPFFGEHERQKYFAEILK